MSKTKLILTILIVLIIINVFWNIFLLKFSAMTLLGCFCENPKTDELYTKEISCNHVTKPHTITAILFSIPIDCRGTEYIMCKDGEHVGSEIRMDEGCKAGFKILHKRVI